MKVHPMFFIAITLMIAFELPAQTSPPNAIVTNAEPVISNPDVKPHPFYYTNDSAALTRQAAKNHWDVVTVSNWFQTNFIVAGTNVSPKFTNWAAGNNISAQASASKWNKSTAWLAFSNWVDTNDFIASLNQTNTTLTPTGRTATNAPPGLDKRLRNDFKDVKDEVRDLFRKKTNSP